MHGRPSGNAVPRPLSVPPPAKGEGSGAATHAPTPGSPGAPLPLLTTEEHQALVRRLRRAQGQVGGVITMLEEGRECRDVVHVLAAATSALSRSGFTLLHHALRQCLADPSTDDTDVAALEKLFLELR